MLLLIDTDIGFFFSLHLQFYASWCEHSQIAEPEFLKAVQMLADSNITGMYIGKIDVTKHGGNGIKFYFEKLVLKLFIYNTYMYSL